MKESLFERIKSIETELEGYSYLETTSHHWYKTNEEVRWIDNDNNVYSGEYYQAILEKGDCVLVNIDTGCGETVTQVFKKELQLSEDEFYGKYEDLM